MRFKVWYPYQSFIDWSIFGVWIRPSLGVPNWTIRHWATAGRSVVVWYVMCLDSLNRALWVKFHGWYWYQSFIDRSNIWGVDGTDPLNPEMDHLPLGCSYLEEGPSYDILRVLILLTDPYAWDSMTDIDINPSSISPIFWVSMGPTLRVSKWTICHWAAAIS